MGGLQKIAADLVAKNRRVEIDAACAYRRVVTVVAVAATSVNGLAVLAAFGGFSLITRLTIDYSVLFTALSTMHIMITPLLTLVQMLPVFISSFVSVNRLRRYINYSSLQKPKGIQCVSDGPLLSFTNAVFGWDPEKPILSGMNLNLCSGEVLSISGPTNSGKSTIMNAVLGEAELLSGNMQTGTKKISYCSQKNWFIPGLSIRDTITLGKQFDIQLYNRIVKGCCLDKDILTLQLGDDAILDNTGAPLSGGQQKRVALARALYHEPDLLLLDEVLTGLDATTLRQVVDNLFGHDGIVKRSGRMGVLMVSTEFPEFLPRQPNTKMFSLNGGQIVAISSVAVVTESSDNGRSGQQLDSIAELDTKLSLPVQASNKKDAITESAVSKRHIVPTAGATKVPSPYRAYFNSFSSSLAISVVLLTLLAGIGIDRASAFWLSKWTSTYEDSQPNADDGYYVGVYASFVAGSAIVSFCGIWVFFMEAIPDSSWTLHKKMLATLLKTSAFTVEKSNPEIINRFTQDIDAIDMNLPQALQNLIFAIASGFGSIIVIAIGSPYTLVLIVFLLPMLYILQKHYLATSAQLRKLQVAAQAPIFSTVGAAVEGRVTLRAMQKQSYMADTLSERVYTGLRPGYLFSSIQRWMLLVLNLANASVLTVLAALLVGLRGRGNIGWAGLALLNAVTLSQDTMLLMIWWTSFENHMASMERILEYTTTPMERVEASELRLEETWPWAGRVKLENLSLSYENHEAVRGVDIDIAPGSKVAVIGRTGSGKTSLTQCLFGLIDVTSGGILVDGVNINTIEPETVRERIVGHPQFTFSNGAATVRKNIDPFDSFSDDAIRQALSRVAAGSYMCDDVMSKLENKWDECGFAAGWQQRIGLARTILRQSNVYVLDEPTSGMDEESHSLVMEALFDALADRTVLVVTHLLLGIERFDTILVMSDGKLVESGRPSELLLDPSTKLSEFSQAASRGAEK